MPSQAGRQRPNSKQYRGHREGKGRGVNSASRPSGQANSHGQSSVYQLPHRSATASLAEFSTGPPMVYRSTSPMTKSMLPTMAGMSAIRQPRQSSLVTLKLQKHDERARTRNGTGSLAGRPTT